VLIGHSVWLVFWLGVPLTLTAGFWPIVTFSTDVVYFLERVGGRPACIAWRFLLRSVPENRGPIFPSITRRGFP